MNPVKGIDHGDRYFRILNTLSGKAQGEISGFMNWVLDNPKIKNILKLLLGCDDPYPVINELWKYYIWGIDPSESLVFREFAIKYIPSSITLNFQKKDSDLSRKALLVGNVEVKKRSIEELEQ